MCNYGLLKCQKRAFLCMFCWLAEACPLFCVKLAYCSIIMISTFTNRFTYIYKFTLDKFNLDLLTFTNRFYPAVCMLCNPLSAAILSVVVRSTLAIALHIQLQVGRGCVGLSLFNHVSIISDIHLVTSLLLFLAIILMVDLVIAAKSTSKYSPSWH